LHVILCGVRNNTPREPAPDVVVFSISGT
jgi:hypothetical protein